MALFEIGAQSGGPGFTAQEARSRERQGFIEQRQAGDVVDIGIPAVQPNALERSGRRLEAAFQHRFEHRVAQPMLLHGERLHMAELHGGDDGGVFGGAHIQVAQWRRMIVQPDHGGQLLGHIDRACQPRGHIALMRGNAQGLLRGRGRLGKAIAAVQHV